MACSSCTYVKICEAFPRPNRRLPPQRRTYLPYLYDKISTQNTTTQTVPFLAISTSARPQNTTEQRLRAGPLERWCTWRSSWQMTRFWCAPFPLPCTTSSAGKVGQSRAFLAVLGADFGLVALIALVRPRTRVMFVFRRESRKNAAKNHVFGGALPQAQQSVDEKIAPPPRVLLSSLRQVLN